MFRNNRGGKRIEYKPEFRHFEIYYIKDSSIKRLFIDTTTLDDGPISFVVYILLVALITILLLFLQNGAVMTLWTNLESIKHQGMFLATTVCALFVPATFIILSKYLQGFFQVFFVCFICLAIEAWNAPSFVRLCTVAEKRNLGDSNGSSFWLVTISVALLCVGWVVLLVFEYQLILRTYVFYSFMVIIDLAIAVFGTKYQIGRLVKASFCVVLRGFFIQMSIYLIYFAFFYGAHLSGPPIFYNYILVDCGILGVFILISVLLGLVKVRNGEKSDSNREVKSNPEGENNRAFREAKYQVPALCRV